MKKMICCLTAVMLLLTGHALASQILTEAYTDVPSVMTQDAVLEFQVKCIDDAHTPAEHFQCALTVLEPNESAMAMLEDVYDFVWRQGNRPVRYYDEETQQKIQDLVPGVDIDILHMTEFMRLKLEGITEETVGFRSVLDVDYRPGQLVVVVLCVEEENGEYRYYPYRARVPEVGHIDFDVPQEDYNEIVELQNRFSEQVIYHVLTDRIGARGNVIRYEEEFHEYIPVPSKSAEDVIRVETWYSKSGEPIDDKFSIFFVEKTSLMECEISHIGEYISQGYAPIEWFPEELRNQAQLLMRGETQVSELLIYDIEAVMSKDYKDTYGDVAAKIRFACAYEPGKNMVAMLGFPKQNPEQAEVMLNCPKTTEERMQLPTEKLSHMEWYCLRTEAMNDEMVELVFKELIIPPMEQEPALLIVFSEPITQE